MPRRVKQITVDVLSDEVRADPYPHYRYLREECPVGWSPDTDSWIAFRYADARNLLRQPGVRHWAVDRPLQENTSYFPRVLASWLSAMDPRNRHTLRRLTTPLFDSQSVASLQGRLNQSAETALDRAEQTGIIDVVNDYAGPIALTAIADLFGIPRDYECEFKQRAHGLVGQLFETVECIQNPMDNPQAAELSDFLRGLLTTEFAPPKSLLSSLREMQRDDGSVGGNELVAFALLFLFAGYENVMNFIGNATAALVASPTQLALLQGKPDLIATAVDELLRFDSPVQYMTVSVDDEIQLGGAHIPPASQILLALGSANRDPDHFDDPDTLDLTRSPNDHLSFGWGPLACIGAGLARLEGQVAIGALARRLRNPVILPPIQLRRYPPVLRGFDNLMLSFGDDSSCR